MASIEECTIDDEMPVVSQTQQESLQVEKRSRSRTPGFKDELVADDLAGSFREHKRAKSPFELGRKQEMLKTSGKAIIDKAAVTDVSSGALFSMEEDVQNYFRHLYDNLIFDIASIQDVTMFKEGSSVEIVIVEEGEEISGDLSAKKKLRWNLALKKQNRSSKKRK